MTRKRSVLDKPADEWTDREIEIEKLRIESARAKAENSVIRRYAPIILSGILSITGIGLTYYVNDQMQIRAAALKSDADKRSIDANEAARQRDLAQNAVRLYFENRDKFDLSTEEGQFNLKVLAATAPGETTKTLLSRIQRQEIDAAVAKAKRAVRKPAAAPAAPDVSTASAAPAERAAPSPAEQARANDARYAAIQQAPSLVENASAPKDFTIYVEYGAGAEDDAGDVRNVLQSAGYTTLNVEPTAEPPAAPEVRYFTDRQAPLARALAVSLSASMRQQVSSNYIGAGRTLPEGVMEVWLPARELGLSRTETKAATGVTQSANLGDGALHLDLSESYEFVSPAALPALLKKLPASGPAGQILGALAPAGKKPGDPDYWLAVLTFDAVGNVLETGADELGALDFLNTVRAARPAAPPLEIFAIAPSYDAASKTLTWAEQYARSGDAPYALRFEQRLLGRGGVAGVTILALPANLERVRQESRAVRAMLSFNPGQRYGDFRASTDQVSKYNLPGLIDGRPRAAGAPAMAPPSEMAAGGISLTFVLLAFVGFILVVGLGALGIRRVFAKRDK